eukprot:8670907-Alexandrium_andersonii.AAC.1
MVRSPLLSQQPAYHSLQARRVAAGIHEDAFWSAIWAMCDHFSPRPELETRLAIRRKYAKQPEELLSALVGQH